MLAWESARRFQRLHRRARGSPWRLERLHRRARDKSAVVGSEGSIKGESIGDTIAIAYDHPATILDSVQE